MAAAFFHMVEIFTLPSSYYHLLLYAIMIVTHHLAVLMGAFDY